MITGSLVLSHVDAAVEFDAAVTVTPADVFGDHLVASEGRRTASYNENMLAKYMKKSELLIHVDVRVGHGKFTVWTCDLTHGYIDINADYRS